MNVVPLHPVVEEPHNIELEQALLGALLLANEPATNLPTFLEAKHFHEASAPADLRCHSETDRRRQDGEHPHCETVSARRCYGGKSDAVAVSGAIGGRGE